MSKLNDKYPEKRGYAYGKLQAYLKEANLTKRFRDNVKKDKHRKKGNDNLYSAFDWLRANEGFYFWSTVTDEFELYKNTGKIFHVYED